MKTKNKNVYENYRFSCQLNKLLCKMIFHNCYLGRVCMNVVIFLGILENSNFWQLSRT